MEEKVNDPVRRRRPRLVTMPMLMPDMLVIMVSYAGAPSMSVVFGRVMLKLAFSVMRRGRGEGGGLECRERCLP